MCTRRTILNHCCSRKVGSFGYHQLSVMLRQWKKQNTLIVPTVLQAWSKFLQHSLRSGILNHLHWKKKAETMTLIPAQGCEMILPIGQNLQPVGYPWTKTHRKRGQGSFRVWNVPKEPFLWAERHMPGSENTSSSFTKISHFTQQIFFINILLRE